MKVKESLKSSCTNFKIFIFPLFWKIFQYGKYPWFGMERGSRPLIWYTMTHWAPPLLGSGTPKMPYSIIQLESDLELITLAQKLIHKRFSKMAGNGFGMERGSRPLIWYPRTYWAPPLLGPVTPQIAL